MTDPVDRIQPNAAPELQTNKQANPQEGSPQFRILLDSLEKLVAEQPKPEEPDGDASALQDALAKADDDYQKVMDLRKSLEDAFQRRMQ